MLTGRKLLLADDSLTIQKVVSLTFTDEAMQVTTAGSGAEALEKLGGSLPDIVLADVFMPEPNGYALCERIKTDERTRHIPVVLLVGTFEPFNEAEARRVGADEVLTKPFQSIRDLVNKVGGLLGGQPEEKTPDAAASRDERRDAEEATRDLSPFAADARAADPAANTSDASTDTSTHPATDAFADFDMDDATIQTTPAAAFDAQHAAAAPDFSEINLEEQFSDRGETNEAFVLSDDDMPTEDMPTQVHAATASASSSPANSLAASPAAESAFDTRAARAAEADDALLELGDITPARAATDEADDFILDIGDEDSFDFAPAAPGHDTDAEADMLFAEHAQTTEAPEAFAMPESPDELDIFSETQSSPQSSAEPWMSASPAVADADAEFDLLADAPEESHAPEILEAPSLLFANEPAQATRDAESFPAREEAREEDRRAQQQHAPAWDGDPVAASVVAHAGGVVATAPASVEASVESRPGEAVASGAMPAADAGASSSAASSGSHQAASSLSPEMLDEVVRRVVAHLSEKVVREIAWEVVPDLAERIIKQRLEEEKPRTQ